MAFAKAVLQKMLLESPSDEHFDVRLIVEAQPPKSGETVLRAHRIVLSTVSDVFRTMFSTGLRDNAEGVVRVSDFTPSAVSESLSLIYGGELSTAATDWKLAGQVWDFGHRFRIDHVATVARSAALAQVSEENCLRVLGFALHIGDDAAVEQLKSFIEEPAHFLRVVRSSEFSMASYEVVCNLRRPGAGTFVEPDILTYEKLWFDALMEWAAADTTPAADVAEKTVRRQGRLQKALRLVDFSRMRTHELREVNRNDSAAESPALPGMLVGILLSRAEKLENLNFEKDRDLEELGAAYQVALFGKNEADRNARLASERLEKVASGKLNAERRGAGGDEDKILRRRSVTGNGVGGNGNSPYPYVPSDHRVSNASYGQSHRRKHSNPSSSPIL